MANLKRFFKKTVSEDRHKQAASVSVPEGLWIKCPKCGEMVYREDVISNAYVCPKCGGYFRISAKRRIKMIADKGSFKEWFTGIDNSNPLDYPDYPQKIEDLREKTHAEGNLVKLAEADVAFHEVIYQASDNKRLIQVLNNMREQIYRYRVEYLKEGETRDVLVKEHEELTKAIRERDVERAKQLSFQHIENQRMAIMRSIEAEDAERERAEKEKSRGHR